MNSNNNQGKKISHVMLSNVFGYLNDSLGRVVTLVRFSSPPMLGNRHEVKYMNDVTH